MCEGVNIFVRLCSFKSNYSTRLSHRLGVFHSRSFKKTDFKCHKAKYNKPGNLDDR